MKLGIVGSRIPGVSYQEWENLLLEKADLSKVEIVISGGAKGIDTYAKIFAARHHIPYMEFAPQYSTYGKYATLKRNTQIVQEASVIAAFPTPESKGTLHSMRETKRLGKRLIIVNIPSNSPSDPTDSRA